MTLEELRKLVREGTRWHAEGWESPDTVFDITLKREDRETRPVLSKELANKTLSYEAREVTVNLDFDDKGYLVGIEFV